MAAPSTPRQRVISELVRQIGNFLVGKPCEVFPTPFDVRLAALDATDDQTNNVVQPDASKDMIHKLRLYERHGVREYWVVHPVDRVVMMWTLGDDGRYGAVLIEETQGSQASALFPDRVLEWDVLFPPPQLKSLIIQ